jgi:hypothetical protein
MGCHGQVIDGKRGPLRRMLTLLEIGTTGVDLVSRSHLELGLKP